MSGHSKWHSIRHKKAATDAKRGKIFTRLIKEVTVAARIGGGDPDANPRLRTAVQSAKAANMPNDNITRAIKKGTGELEGVHYEEITYEGYGTGGVAIIVETVTDNRNRTTSEMRHIFSKYGGHLGETHCVSWMFDRRSVILIDADGVDEDELMLQALDAGAEDVTREEEAYEIISASTDHHAVLEGLKKAGYKPSSDQITMVPKNRMKLEDKDLGRTMKLFDRLDDHDDVQNLYFNLEIQDEVLEGAEGA